MLILSLNRQAVYTVLASCVLTFTGCGLNFAFGIYQELYESMEGPFSGASAAEIDLIGTLAVSLMTIGAPFASAWTKEYSPRNVTLVGALCFSLANLLASFGQELWHFVLTQGFMLGCASCLSYIPAVTIAPGWFDRRRGLAMGIILGCTGVGGVVWAPVLHKLNDSIGFRNTLRATAALSFPLMAAAGYVLKWDPVSEHQNRVNRESTSGSPAVRIPLVNWQVARSRKFVAQALGTIFQAAAYYTPLYFLSSYSRTLGYSAAAGANLISISNASNAGGKVVLGYIADRFGRLNTLLICTMVSAVSALALWLPSTSAGGMLMGRALFTAFTVLYSIFAGAYVSLFPTVLAELFGAQNFTSVNGFLYMLRGLGILVGTPAAGALIRSGSSSNSTFPESRGYEKSSTMVGILLVLATLAVLWGRLEAVGIKEWKWKV